MCECWQNDTEPAGKPRTTWGWHTRLSIKPSVIRIFTPLMKVNHPEWEEKRADGAKLAAGSADSVPRVPWATMTLQDHGFSRRKSPRLMKSFNALGAVAPNPITQTCISMLIFKQGNCSPNRADQIKANVYKGGFEWRCEILFVYVETLFFKHHCYI